ncbi:hypothetical protein F4775DRAFT_335993 [Biscogniauxia sp. FL1348]|nr:hypothetical protein F4775DRAFT_335993 [Biscogniauxia sp. FL1348]
MDYFLGFFFFAFFGGTPHSSTFFSLSSLPPFLVLQLRVGRKGRGRQRKDRKRKQSLQSILSIPPPSRSFRLCSVHALYPYSRPQISSRRCASRSFIHTLGMHIHIGIIFTVSLHYIPLDEVCFLVVVFFSPAFVDRPVPSRLRREMELRRLCFFSSSILILYEMLAWKRKEI